MSPYSAKREYALGVIRTAYVGRDGIPVSEVDCMTSVSLGSAVTGARVTYTPATLLLAFAGSPLTRILDSSTGVFNRWRISKVAMAPNLLNICPSMAYALTAPGSVGTPNSLSDVLNLSSSTIHLNGAQTSALTSAAPWSPKKDFTVSLDLDGTDEVWLDNTTAATSPNLFTAVRFSASSTTDSVILMVRVQLKGFNTI